MDKYFAAESWEPQPAETATHKGRATGNLYREPGSGAAVKWLVYRHGEMMAGWVGMNYPPEEDLLALQ